MAEHGHASNEQDNGTATLPPPPKREVKTLPQRPRMDRLPPWKVLLHNDNHHTIGYVIETLIALTPLDPHESLERTLEAHQKGVSLLLATHREHAELIQDQFTSKGLTVTIEPERG